MMISKKPLLKIVSLSVLFFFVSTDIARAVPPGGIVLAPVRETPGFLEIEIPQELASIEEIYEAPAQADPNLVVHIQNIHGHYEAQSQIKKLLGYLYEKYGFKLLLVEGAAQELDREYLELFEKPENNLALADRLTREGQLNGVEYYLMDSPEDVRAVGIEDAKLYRENYEDFKAVHQAENKTNHFLQKLEQNLESLSSRIFSQEMRKMLSEWRKFEAGHRDFLPYVKRLSEEAKRVLGLDLGSLFSQVEWPQLTRILVLQEMEKDLDLKAAEKEKAEVIEFLKEKRISQEIIEAIESLEERRITLAESEEVRKLKDIPRYLFEKLAGEAAPKGFYFHQYPAFSLWAGHIILKNELDSQGLFKEINKIFEKILNELAVTEKEQNLLELYRDANLLEKLLNLKLTREEWKQTTYRSEWLKPEVMQSRIKKLTIPSPSGRGQGEGRNPHPPAEAGTFSQREKGIEPIYTTAQNFYEIARKREDVFYETLSKEMKASGEQKAVLVTGGFHTEGMLEKLREEKISYSVLMPNLRGGNLDQSNYIETMLETKPTMFDVGTIEYIGLLQDAMMRYEQGLYRPEEKGALIRETEYLTQELKHVLQAFVDIGIYATWEEAAKAFNYYNGTKYSSNRKVKLDYQDRTLNIEVDGKSLAKYYRNQDGNLQINLLDIPVGEDPDGNIRAKAHLRKGKKVTAKTEARGNEPMPEGDYFVVDIVLNVGTTDKIREIEFQFYEPSGRLRKGTLTSPESLGQQMELGPILVTERDATTEVQKDDFFEFESAEDVEPVMPLLKALVDSPQIRSELKNKAWTSLLALLPKSMQEQIKNSPEFKLTKEDRERKLRQILAYVLEKLTQEEMRIISAGNEGDEGDEVQDKLFDLIDQARGIMMLEDEELVKIQDWVQDAVEKEVEGLFRPEDFQIESFELLEIGVDTIPESQKESEPIEYQFIHIRADLAAGHLLLRMSSIGTFEIYLKDEQGVFRDFSSPAFRWFQQLIVREKEISKQIIAALSERRDLWKSIGPADIFLPPAWRNAISGKSEGRTGMGTGLAHVVVQQLSLEQKQRLKQVITQLMSVELKQKQEAKLLEELKALLQQTIDSGQFGSTVTEDIKKWRDRLEAGKDIPHYGLRHLKYYFRKGPFEMGLSLQQYTLSESEEDSGRREPHQILDEPPLYSDDDFLEWLFSEQSGLEPSELELLNVRYGLIGGQEPLPLETISGVLRIGFFNPYIEIPRRIQKIETRAFRDYRNYLASKSNSESRTAENAVQRKEKDLVGPARSESRTEQSSVQHLEDRINGLWEGAGEAMRDKSSVEALLAMKQILGSIQFYKAIEGPIGPDDLSMSATIKVLASFLFFKGDYHRVLTLAPNILSKAVNDPALSKDEVWMPALLSLYLVASFMKPGNDPPSGKFDLIAHFDHALYSLPAKAKSFLQTQMKENPDFAGQTGSFFGEGIEAVVNIYSQNHEYLKALRLTGRYHHTLTASKSRAPGLDESQLDEFFEDLLGRAQRHEIASREGATPVVKGLLDEGVSLSEAIQEIRSNAGESWDQPETAEAQVAYRQVLEFTERYSLIHNGIKPEDWDVPSFLTHFQALLFGSEDPRYLSSKIVAHMEEQLDFYQQPENEDLFAQALYLYYLSQFINPGNVFDIVQKGGHFIEQAFDRLPYQTIVKALGYTSHPVKQKALLLFNQGTHRLFQKHRLSRNFTQAEITLADREDAIKNESEIPDEARAQIPALKAALEREKNGEAEILRSTPNTVPFPAGEAVDDIATPWQQSIFDKQFEIIRRSRVKIGDLEVIRQFWGTPEQVDAIGELVEAFAQLYEAVDEEGLPLARLMRDPEDVLWMLSAVFYAGSPEHVLWYFNQVLESGDEALIESMTKHEGLVALSHAARRVHRPSVELFETQLREGNLKSWNQFYSFFEALKGFKGRMALGRTIYIGLEAAQGPLRLIQIQMSQIGEDDDGEDALEMVELLERSHEGGPIELQKALGELWSKILQLRERHGRSESRTAESAVQGKERDSLEPARSEARDLTEEEKQIILSQRTIREDSGPVRQVTETDFFKIFAIPVGKDTRVPDITITPEMIEGKDVLLAPGYSNYSGFLMSRGAKSLTGINLSKVEIAWQKAMILYGKHPKLQKYIEDYKLVERMNQPLVPDAPFDVLREMVSQGVAPQPLEGASYQQADIQQLPFTDNSFDLVIVHFILGFQNGIVNEEGFEAVLQEMIRVTRSGGNIIVLPAAVDEWSDDGSGLAWYQRVQDEITGRKMSGMTQQEIADAYDDYGDLRLPKEYEKGPLEIFDGFYKWLRRFPDIQFSSLFEFESFLGRGRDAGIALIPVAKSESRTAESAVQGKERDLVGPASSEARDLKSRPEQLRRKHHPFQNFDKAYRDAGLAATGAGKSAVEIREQMINLVKKKIHSDQTKVVDSGNIDQLRESTRVIMPEPLQQLDMTPFVLEAAYRAGVPVDFDVSLGPIWGVDRFSANDEMAQKVHQLLKDIHEARQSGELVLKDLRWNIVTQPLSGKEAQSEQMNWTLILYDGEDPLAEISLTWKRDENQDLKPVYLSQAADMTRSEMLGEPLSFIPTSGDLLSRVRLYRYVYGFIHWYSEQPGHGLSLEEIEAQAHLGTGMSSWINGFAHEPHPEVSSRKQLTEVYQEILKKDYPQVDYVKVLQDAFKKVGLEATANNGQAKVIRRFIAMDLSQEVAALRVATIIKKLNELAESSESKIAQIGEKYFQREDWFLNLAVEIQEAAKKKDEDRRRSPSLADKATEAALEELEFLTPGMAYSESRTEARYRSSEISVRGEARVFEQADIYGLANYLLHNLASQLNVLANGEREPQHIKGNIENIFKELQKRRDVNMDYFTFFLIDHVEGLVKLVKSGENYPPKPVLNYIRHIEELFEFWKTQEWVSSEEKAAIEPLLPIFAQFKKDLKSKKSSKSEGRLLRTKLETLWEAHHPFRDFDALYAGDSVAARERIITFLFKEMRRKRVKQINAENLKDFISFAKQMLPEPLQRLDIRPFVFEAAYRAGAKVDFEVSLGVIGTLSRLEPRKEAKEVRQLLRQLDNIRKKEWVLRDLRWNVVTHRAKQGESVRDSDQIDWTLVIYDGNNPIAEISARWKSAEDGEWELVYSAQEVNSIRSKVVIAKDSKLVATRLATNARLYRYLYGFIDWYSKQREDLSLEEIEAAILSKPGSSSWIIPYGKQHDPRINSKENLQRVFKTILKKDFPKMDYAAFLRTAFNQIELNASPTQGQVGLVKRLVQKGLSPKVASLRVSTIVKTLLTVAPAIIENDNQFVIFALRVQEGSVLKDRGRPTSAPLANKGTPEALKSLSAITKAFARSESRELPTLIEGAGIERSDEAFYFVEQLVLRIKVLYLDQRTGKRYSRDYQDIEKLNRELDGWLEEFGGIPENTELRSNIERMRTGNLISEEEIQSLIDEARRIYQDDQLVQQIQALFDFFTTGDRWDPDAVIPQIKAINLRLARKGFIMAYDQETVVDLFFTDRVSFVARELIAAFPHENQGEPFYAWILQNATQSASSEYGVYVSIQDIARIVDDEEGDLESIRPLIDMQLQAIESDSKDSAEQRLAWILLEDMLSEEVRHYLHKELEEDDDVEGVQEERVTKMGQVGMGRAPFVTLAFLALPIEKMEEMFHFYAPVVGAVNQAGYLIAMAEIAERLGMPEAGEFMEFVRNEVMEDDVYALNSSFPEVENHDYERYGLTIEGFVNFFRGVGIEKTVEVAEALYKEKRGLQVRFGTLKNVETQVQKLRDQGFEFDFEDKVLKPSKSESRTAKSAVQGEERDSVGPTRSESRAKKKSSLEDALTGYLDREVGDSEIKIKVKALNQREGRYEILFHGLNQEANTDERLNQANQKVRKALAEKGDISETKSGETKGVKWRRVTLTLKKKEEAKTPTQAKRPPPEEAKPTSSRFTLWMIAMSLGLFLAVIGALIFAFSGDDESGTTGKDNVPTQPVDQGKTKDKIKDKKPPKDKKPKSKKDRKGKAKPSPKKSKGASSGKGSEIDPNKVVKSKPKDQVKKSPNLLARVRFGKYDGRGHLKDQTVEPFPVKALGKGFALGGIGGIGPEGADLNLSDYQAIEVIYKNPPKNKQSSSLVLEFKQRAQFVAQVSITLDPDKTKHVKPIDKGELPKDSSFDHWGFAEGGEGPAEIESVRLISGKGNDVVLSIAKPGKSKDSQPKPPAKKPRAQSKPVAGDPDEVATTKGAPADPKAVGKGKPKKVTPIEDLTFSLEERTKPLPKDLEKYRQGAMRVLSKYLTQKGGVRRIGAKGPLLVFDRINAKGQVFNPLAKFDARYTQPLLMAILAYDFAAQYNGRAPKTTANPFTELRKLRLGVLKSMQTKDVVRNPAGAPAWIHHENGKILVENRKLGIEDFAGYDYFLVAAVNELLAKAASTKNERTKRVILGEAKALYQLVEQNEAIWVTLVDKNDGRFWRDFDVKAGAPVTVGNGQLHADMIKNAELRSYIALRIAMLYAKGKIPKTVWTQVPLIIGKEGKTLYVKPYRSTFHTVYNQGPLETRYRRMMLLRKGTGQMYIGTAKDGNLKKGFFPTATYGRGGKYNDKGGVPFSIDNTVADDSLLVPLIALGFTDQDVMRYVMGALRSPEIRKLRNPNRDLAGLYFASQFAQIHPGDLILPSLANLIGVGSTFDPFLEADWLHKIKDGPKKDDSILEVLNLMYLDDKWLKPEDGKGNPVKIILPAKSESRTEQSSVQGKERDSVGPTRSESRTAAEDFFKDYDDSDLQIFLRGQVDSRLRKLGVADVIDQRTDQIFQEIQKRGLTDSQKVIWAGLINQLIIYLVQDATLSKYAREFIQKSKKTLRIWLSSTKDEETIIVINQHLGLFDQYEKEIQDDAQSESRTAESAVQRKEEDRSIPSRSEVLQELRKSAALELSERKSRTEARVQLSDQQIGQANQIKSYFGIGIAESTNVERWIQDQLFAAENEELVGWVLDALLTLRQVTRGYTELELNHVLGRSTNLRRELIETESVEQIQDWTRRVLVFLGNPLQGFGPGNNGAPPEDVRPFEDWLQDLNGAIEGLPSYLLADYSNEAGLQSPSLDQAAGLLERHDTAFAWKTSLTVLSDIIREIEPADAQEREVRLWRRLLMELLEIEWRIQALEEESPLRILLEEGIRDQINIFPFDAEEQQINRDFAKRIFYLAEVVRGLGQRLEQMGEPIELRVDAKDSSSIAHRGKVTAVKFSPDERLIASVGQGGVLRVWDARTLTFLYDRNLKTSVNTVAFSPDGKQIATGDSKGYITLWDAQSGKRISRFSVNGFFSRKAVWSVQFSPDGSRIASLSNVGKGSRKEGERYQLSLWDAKTGEQTLRILGSTGFTELMQSTPWDSEAIAFNPNGKQVLVATAGTYADTWDAETGASLRRSQNLNHFLAFSPNGQLIAARGYHQGMVGRILIHELDAPENITPLGPQVNPPIATSVVFNPDGRHLVNGNRSGGVTVWDVQTAQPILNLLEPDAVDRRAHPGVVSSVAMSPDGKRIASADESGRVRIWGLGWSQDFVDADEMFVVYEGTPVPASEAPSVQVGSSSRGIFATLVASLAAFLVILVLLMPIFQLGGGAYTLAQGLSTGQKIKKDPNGQKALSWGGLGSQAPTDKKNVYSTLDLAKSQLVVVEVENEEGEFSHYEVYPGSARSFLESASKKAARLGDPGLSSRIEGLIDDLEKDKVQVTGSNEGNVKDLYLSQRLDIGEIQEDVSEKATSYYSKVPENLKQDYYVKKLVAKLLFVFALPFTFLSLFLLKRNGVREVYEYVQQRFQQSTQDQAVAQSESRVPDNAAPAKSEGRTEEVVEEALRPVVVATPAFSELADESLREIVLDATQSPEFRRKAARVLGVRPASNENLLALQKVLGTPNEIANVLVAVLRAYLSLRLKQFAAAISSKDSTQQAQILKDLHEKVETSLKLANILGKNAEDDWEVRIENLEGAFRVSLSLLTLETLQSGTLVTVSSHLQKLLLNFKHLTGSILKSANTNQDKANNTRLYREGLIFLKKMVHNREAAKRRLERLNQDLSLGQAGQRLAAEYGDYTTTLRGPLKQLTQRLAASLRLSSAIVGIEVGKVLAVSEDSVQNILKAATLPRPAKTEAREVESVLEVLRKKFNEGSNRRNEVLAALSAAERLRQGLNFRFEEEGRRIEINLTRRTDEAAPERAVDSADVRRYISTIRDLLKSDSDRELYDAVITALKEELNPKTRQEAVEMATDRLLALYGRDKQNAIAAFLAEWNDEKTTSSEKKQVLGNAREVLGGFDDAETWQALAEEWALIATLRAVIAYLSSQVRNDREWGVDFVERVWRELEEPSASSSGLETIVQQLGRLLSVRGIEENEVFIEKARRYTPQILEKLTRGRSEVRESPAVAASVTLREEVRLGQPKLETIKNWSALFKIIAIAGGLTRLLSRGSQKDLLKQYAIDWKEIHLSDKAKRDIQAYQASQTLAPSKDFGAVRIRIPGHIPLTQELVRGLWWMMRSQEKQLTAIVYDAEEEKYAKTKEQVKTWLEALNQDEAVRQDLGEEDIRKRFLVIVTNPRNRVRIHRRTPSKMLAIAKQLNFVSSSKKFHESFVDFVVDTDETEARKAVKEIQDYSLGLQIYLGSKDITEVMKLLTGSLVSMKRSQGAVKLSEEQRRALQKEEEALWKMLSQKLDGLKASVATDIEALKKLLAAA